MAYLRVPEWSPDEVADWLKGLDECFRPYVHSFLNNDIDGRHLMTISSDDLNHLNIWKIGHQELLMEAVEQLRQSYYHLDVENLQWLALKASCKARGLYNELSRASLPNLSHNLHNHNYNHHHNIHNDIQQSGLFRKPEQVATTTLSAVADLITSVKALVTWIDRPPFTGQQNYRKKRSILIQKCVELATNAQRDKFAEKPNEVIRDICFDIDIMCDELIKEKKDPLVLQPSYLEIATIKKKPNEELGMHITSSYCGIHSIGSIKYQSPTSACGRLETGDEIVQVNYQTVVGWQLTKLVSAMKENSSEVILTVKKRPKHSNTFGRIFPNNFLFMSKRASPKSARPKSSNKTNGEKLLLPPEVLVPKPTPPVVFSVPVPQPLVLTQTLQPTVSQGPVVPTVICPPEPTTEDDEDDDSAFLSEADSRSMASEAHLSIPKMHVALQRRATVTGASPTATRPPVSIDQLWHNAKRDQIIRSYSHDVSRLDHPLTLKKPTEFKMENKDKPVIDSEVTEKEQKSPPKVPERSPPKIPERLPPKLPERSPPKVAERSLKIENENHLQVASVAKNSDEPKVPSKTETSLSHIQPSSDVSPNFSYQVVIVGGVPHRQPSNGKDIKESSFTLPVLRKKRKGRGHSNRRISCKDLGEGECHGWLYRWKEIRGMFLNNHKWVKEWCVLKSRCFYVYDDEESQRARCFICLKGFNVSPAPDFHKSKRYAFQIYRSGASFLFCTESQSDLSKWMNKLGLAAIDYEKTSDDKPEKISKVIDKSGEDYSETDEDDDLGPSSDDQSSLVSSNQVETASTSSLSSSSSYQSTVENNTEVSSLQHSKKEQIGGRIIKSRSLDWKNLSKYLDTYTSPPPTPTIEPAKMSLVFEMNLDSTPPSPMKKQQHPPSPKVTTKLFTSPKLIKKSSKTKTEVKTKTVDWFTGDHAATLPATTPSYKSSESLGSRLLGSPKLIRAFNKAFAPASSTVKEPLFPHSTYEFQTVQTESWKPFRISSIPSHEDEVAVPAAKTDREKKCHSEPLSFKPTIKPAMGIAMIGKQRRTGDNRPATTSSFPSMTNSQSTQTDIS